MPADSRRCARTVVYFDQDAGHSGAWVFCAPSCQAGHTDEDDLEWAESTAEYPGSGPNSPRQGSCPLGGALPSDWRQRADFAVGIEVAGDGACARRSPRWLVRAWRGWV